MLREIPRESWRQFLSAFAGEYRGLPITLEHCCPVGKVVEAQNWPLQQLVCETVAGHQKISIVVGDEERAPLTHVVDDPTGIRVSDGEDEQQVEFAGSDDRVTVLHCAPATKRQPRAAAAT